MCDLFERNPPRPAPTRGCSYVARVPFDHGERHFEPGDLYPYAELGKHELEAHNMFRAGMLAVATPEDLERLTAPTVRPPPKRAAASARR